MTRANDVSRAGYTAGRAPVSGIAAWVAAIAVVAALAVFFGLAASGGADANERFDGRIVPIMVVSADYQERAEALGYESQFTSYINELDDWFTWSTGGLALDRVEPQFLSVPYTNHQLWCADLMRGVETPAAVCDGSNQNLESNIDHLIGKELGIALRPDNIGAGSPSPWVAVWGAAGYAGEPMFGEAAFYVYMNNGSCDGILNAFPSDTTTELCARTPRGSWVGSGLGSAVHELAHQSWDLSHPSELVNELARPAALRNVIGDPAGQLMETPSQFPAAAWADYELAMIEGLDARYVDLSHPDSPIAYLETSTYVTGASKPALPVVPTLLASRDGSMVDLQIVGSAPVGTTYRVFALDAETTSAGQHVPVVASTTETNLRVPFRHGACFLVMAWSADHRPSMPSNRWGACVDRDPAIVSSTNRAPSLGYVAPQEGRVGEEVAPVELSARDRDGDAVEIIARGLPVGLSFDVKTRSIVGVPTAIGIYEVDVSADDGRGRFTTRSFTWTITSSNSLTFNPTPTPVEYQPPVVDPPPSDIVDDGCGAAVQTAGQAALSGVVTRGTAPIDGRADYASVADGVGDLYRFEGPASESSIRFCASVDQAGQYIVFGSTIAPDSKSDSFFVRIDGGEVFPWHIPQSTVWRRNVVRQPASPPLVMDLEAGDHVFEFFHREDGVQFERFELVRV